MSESRSMVPYTLRAIYIRTSHTELAKWFDPLTVLQIDGEFRVLDGNVECRVQEVAVTDEKPSEQKTCVFTTRFEFRYTLHDGQQVGRPDGDEVAKISAEISADYLFNGDNFPPNEEMHKWGQINVLLHTWPYWREYCHNALWRMQLPVTLMPLVNISPPKEPAIQQSTRKAKRSGKVE